MGKGGVSVTGKGVKGRTAQPKRAGLFGFDRLMKKFDALTTAAKEGGIKILIGYDRAQAPYALAVHEDWPMEGSPHPHKPPTQAGWLVAALRTNTAGYRTTIRNKLQKGMGMERAFLETALYILERANLICPEDTGNLKRSGFVEQEEGGRESGGEGGGGP